MAAFERGKGGNASIYVHTRHGGLVQRSCGSRVPAIVRGMARMNDALRDRGIATGNWTVLDAIFAKKVTLKQVYPSFVSNQLVDLEARLNASNLSASLDGWIAWVRANRHEDVRTADVYWQQVTTLVKPGEVFPESDLTKARVVAWLTKIDASSGTKRKYLYALKSFVRYLIDVGVLPADPLAGLKAPKKDPARRRWVTAAVDETIVANAIPEYCALFAFVKGTGCDLGSALRAQKGDVNLFAGKTDVRGTKTDHRAVHQATIEPWALPYVRAHIKAMGDADRHELLFPEMGRSGPSHHHKRICATLRVDDYTLKDARHSVAVRMRKAGKSFEEIAAQLGTSVFQTVQVYAAYTPDEAEIERNDDEGNVLTMR